MSIDPKIKQAIAEAVTAAQQSPKLTTKISRWFESIATGSEDINDKSSAYRHVELLYDDVEVNTDKFDKDDDNI